MVIKSTSKNALFSRLLQSFCAQTVMYCSYTPVLRAITIRTHKKITVFKRTLLLLSVPLLFNSFSVQASPKIETWNTSQGTPVYYVHAPELPMVDMEIVFDAGGSRNGDLPGLAGLTNGLLNQGADGLNADQISQGFESLGAIYGSSAGYDSGSVSLRTLTDEKLLAKAIENLKRVVTKADFPEDALERRRARTLIALQSKQQSPGTLARDAFMRATYQTHPYANPTDGTVESINAITRQNILDFYKKYYVSNNALVAIVGAVDRIKAEEIAEDLVSGLPKGEKAAPLEAVSDLKKAETVKIEHPSAQTHILVGQPGLKRGDPDYFPLYVGNHVLGGGGMVSRLFEEIREKRGLSYSAYSYFSPMRFNGPFLAGLQTRSDQVQEALSVLMDNINKFIEEGPTEDELTASKKNITGGYALRIDSNSKILDYVVVIAYYGLPLNYLETFNANVEAVTIEQIKDAFKRRLSPDKLVTVMVGSKPEQKKE